MADRWLSVDEIAHDLGIGRARVSTWLGPRGRPGHRIGRLRSFKRDEEAPGPFSESTERTIARNLLSSWTRSGHLTGHREKTRTRDSATPGSNDHHLTLEEKRKAREERGVRT